MRRQGASKLLGSILGGSPLWPPNWRCKDCPQDEPNEAGEVDSVPEQWAPPSAVQSFLLSGGAPSQFLDSSPPKSGACLHFTLGLPCSISTLGKVPTACVSHHKPINRRRGSLVWQGPSLFSFTNKRLQHFLSIPFDVLTVFAVTAVSCTNYPWSSRNQLVSGVNHNRLRSITSLAKCNAVSSVLCRYSCRNHPSHHAIISPECMDDPLNLHKRLLLLTTDIPLSETIIETCG